MKNHLKLILFIFSLVPTAFADVDLRAQFGPLHQKNHVGWCYAYTASDLLTHWINARYPQVLRGNAISATGIALAYLQPSRAGNISDIRSGGVQLRAYREAAAAAQARVEQLESGLAVANVDEIQNIENELNEARVDLQNKNDKVSGFGRPSVPEGGEADDSIRRSFAQGFCFESSLSSRALNASTEEVASLAPTGMTEFSVFQLENAFRVSAQNGEISNTDAMQNAVEKIFNRYDFSNHNITQLMSSSDPMAELFSAQCRDIDIQSIAQPVFTRMTEREHGAEDLIVFARETLDAGRPVEVGFNSEILNHPGGHSATLVGYRVVENGREFLLRNMWGAQSCLQDLSNGPARAFSCDPEGYYWIPESTLAPVLGHIMRIENY